MYVNAAPLIVELLLLSLALAPLADLAFPSYVKLWALNEVDVFDLVIEHVSVLALVTSDPLFHL